MANSLSAPAIGKAFWQKGGGEAGKVENREQKKDEWRGGRKEGRMKGRRGELPIGLYSHKHISYGH